LSKEILSLSMLSYIESGQFKLKVETAVKLTDRLNYFINDHSKKITYEYILETPKEQIKRIMVFELRNLKNFNLEKLGEFRSTFEKFDCYYDYIKLFFVLGKSLRIKNISMAESLYEEVLDVSINKGISTFLFNIILELQRIYSVQGNFNKTISLYKKVNKYLHESPLLIGGYI